MQSAARVIGAFLLVAGAVCCFTGLLGIIFGCVLMVLGGAVFAHSFLET